ncbi:dihydroorotate dehydrogenase [Dechloromonas hortensis]|uniref:dihydroorotate dehydrogenase n=1 Tax=Dechloromonas hortensis TaxID=337779 RepID=UPI001291E755|nr:dihydroorotate dehydrogenase [Dechloromonas hortensis]
MSRRLLPWLARPGLAGGIDKDGSRAGELLAVGFGSVEFGSVMPDGLADVAERLATWRGTSGCALGAGLGLPPAWPAEDLAMAWLAGLEALAGSVDYLSFNLSAAANRRFMHAEHRVRLADACRRLAWRRNVLAAESGRYLPLALKLPLGGPDDPLPMAALIGAAAGFDQLTVVLPEDNGRFVRLAALTAALGQRPAVVAVGGIRSAAEVAAARQAGAAGVQVHRLFVEQGADCLMMLGEAKMPIQGRRPPDSC